VDRDDLLGARRLLVRSQVSGEVATLVPFDEGLALGDAVGPEGDVPELRSGVDERAAETLALDLDLQADDLRGGGVQTPLEPRPKDQRGEQTEPDEDQGDSRYPRELPTSPQGVDPPLVPAEGDESRAQEAQKTEPVHGVSLCVRGS
jgi:hypothetical protein